MRRFWLEFENPKDVPAGMGWGCGITANSLDDALSLLRERALKNRDIPTIKRIVEDVNIEELDSGHIRPNMGNIFVRGIWYPLGFDTIE